MLNQVDQMQDNFFLQPRFQGRSDDVPQQIRHTDDFPVPDLGTRPSVGVSIHQAGRELVLELGRQRPENGGIGTGEFTAIGSCSSCTRGTPAHVFAPDDEERFLDVVYLDGAGGDAALVGKRLGTSRAGNSIEDERMRVPVQEAVFRGCAGRRGRCSEREIRRRRREPERLEDRIQRGNGLRLLGGVCEGYQMGSECFLCCPTVVGSGIWRCESSQENDKQYIGLAASKLSPVVQLHVRVDVKSH